ncbi:uncharacterized protein LOC118204907 [Stegodyphus dumicola]|uniref:uncharacterized protein LOC118204907 n=1 Tax=Stegodyphus dumicola TaxID=202533 RepID=UPI0015B32BDB|nr:uncharacterized protein LOC118204907 [Stegodyphus dumicola]
MKFTSTGEVVPVDINLSKRRYLGAREFSLSLWERHIIAEKERVKVLKRDLKILDDWLKSISTPMTEILEAKEDTPTEWKEKEQSFRRRTRRVHGKMESARQKLVKSLHIENDEAITHVLSPKECPGRVPPKKKKYIEATSSEGAKRDVNKADQLETSVTLVPDNIEAGNSENDAPQPQLSIPLAAENADESQIPSP